eukprot:10414620-Ditylum_brightwellii.AAC.1
MAFDKLDAPPQEDELYSFKAVVALTWKEDERSKRCCCFSVFKEKDPLVDPETIKSFLNHPPLQAMGNPITILNIQQHQFEDLPLNNLRRQDLQRFPVKEIEGRPLICFGDKLDDPMGLW